jgi:hypothetical protein
MLEVNKPRQRAKGGGRKPLEKKAKKLNRQESVKKYRESKKQFACMLSDDVYNALKSLKYDTGLSYECLISKMVEKWS